MILGVQRLGVQTVIDFDDNPGFTVDDPDGSIFAQASAIAEPQKRYRSMVESGEVTPYSARTRGPQSPAAMRGSGELGADMRLAEAGDSPGVTQPLPYGNVVERVSNWAGDRFSKQRSADAARPTMQQQLAGVDAAVSAPGTSEGVLAAAAGASSPSPAQSSAAPTDSNEGLFYVPGGTQTSTQTTTVKDGPQRSTQTRQVDAGAYNQSLDASASLDKGYRDEALRRLGLDPAHFDDQITKIKTEQAATEKALADEQAKKQRLETTYEQAAQVPEDAARLWGQPGFAISAAIGGFFSSLMDLKQARKGQQSLNLGARFWQSIDRIVDRDVQAQRANKNSQLAMLERQLGSTDAAVSAFRSQRFGLVMQELQTMQTKGMFDAQQREQLEGRIYEAGSRREEERRQFLVAQAPVVNQTDATTRTQTTTQTTTVPGKTMSRLELMRDALGYSAEHWEKGMNAKLDPTKERSPTVATALQALQQHRDDTQAYREVRGLSGKVVTRDVLDKLSQATRKLLGDMNFNTNGTTAVTSEMLEQLDSIYHTKLAKGSGGVITDGDIERAQKEFGNSTTGKLRYLERIEREFEGNLKGALNTYFLGKGDQIIDMMRQGNAGIRGLDAPSLRRRGSIN